MQYFSLFDMAICAIPAVGFGVWQLVSVNREIAKDKLAKEGAKAAASPEGARHPVGEHGLDNR